MSTIWTGGAPVVTEPEPPGAMRGDLSRPTAPAIDAHIGRVDRLLADPRVRRDLERAIATPSCSQVIAIRPCHDETTWADAFECVVDRLLRHARRVLDGAGDDESGADLAGMVIAAFGPGEPSPEQLDWLYALAISEPADPAVVAATKRLVRDAFDTDLIHDHVAEEDDGDPP